MPHLLFFLLLSLFLPSQSSAWFLEGFRLPIIQSPGEPPSPEQIGTEISPEKTNLDQKLVRKKPIPGLLHNSETTGSTDWEGSGWGIKEGKYGTFTCSTCHRNNTINIKRIETTIAMPPDADVGDVWPNGQKEFDVFFNSPPSAYFVENNLPGAVSYKICEACHTYSQSSDGVKYHTHKSDGEDHHTGSDCVICHQHKDGFAAPYEEVQAR